MINQHLKQIKKRADANNVIKADLTSCTQHAEKLITVLRDTAKSAVGQISIATGIVKKFVFVFFNYYRIVFHFYYLFNILDDKKISSEKIMQVLNNSVEKIFEKEEFSKGVIVCLKICISTLASEIANAAQAVQEADLTIPTSDTSKVKLYPVVIIPIISSIIA